MNLPGDYATANLQVYLLRSLAALATQAGIDPERLCMGLGFNLADLSDPRSRVSFRQASAMIRRAVRMIPDHGLGLRLGMSSTIASFGLVGYAMLTSPTFGEAVSLGVRLQNDAGSLLQLDLRRQGQMLSTYAASRYDEPDIQVFLVEEAFSSFLRIAQGLVGNQFHPAGIDLTYEKPSYAKRYEQIFRCPVRFLEKDNVFYWHDQWAERPLPTYDPLSHRQALELFAFNTPAQPPASDLLESIERIIRRNLRDPPQLAAVATALCLSPRTLRRRLAQGACSYQTLLDTARKDRALALLRNPSLSLDRIAAEVGFADVRNFRRAFKRWTGQGPRQFRS